jgi:hypothetical protein
VSMENRNEIEKYSSRSLIIEFIWFMIVVDELVEGQLWRWLKQLPFYFNSRYASASMGDAVIPLDMNIRKNRKLKSTWSSIMKISTCF